MTCRFCFIQRCPAMVGSLYSQRHWGTAKKGGAVRHFQFVEKHTVKRNRSLPPFFYFRKDFFQPACFPQWIGKSRTFVVHSELDVGYNSSPLVFLSCAPSLPIGWWKQESRLASVKLVASQWLIYFDLVLKKNPRGTFEIPSCTTKGIVTAWVQ